MARRQARPGRRLLLFGLAVLLLYGGVALGDHSPTTKGYQVGGEWKPKLGLDLQGGTRITLQASTAGGQNPTPANLQEARGIIDQRVNGTGVAEAEVGTQGNNNIVVEIPGKNRQDLVDAVSRTAQLRFRLVAAAAAGTPQAAATPSPGASGSPSGSASPSAKASGGASSKASPKASAKPSAKASPKASSKASSKATATPKGRALSSGLLAADAPSKKASSTPTPKPSAAATPTATASGSAPASADPSAIASALASANASASAAAPATTPKGAPITQPLKWVDNPGDAWLKKFSAYTCPKGGAVPDDSKTQPLVTCDADGVKYLLSAPVIEGTELKSASAVAPGQQYPTWTVDLTFNGSGRKTFATVTTAIANQTSALTQQQKTFAVVLDGKVLSAPTVDSPIVNGSAVISGSFTQASSMSLANSLKYGALPLKFEVPVTTFEGPTLASDQLSAGLIAGGIGLALVLIYCLLYYRGLGLVVLFSLLFAGIITYAAVLVMSQAVGFTLTLPGIAGLIVAVGITADSFIVYFERIRDEMRNGKSMRVAVEAGWVRARATCLAADAVSLLAAVVLYIFSIGVVKGFAFTLGISTLIDLVVFFLFTKPMVSWLATFRFFYSGHAWSGLSPDHVGTKRRAVGRSATAGGNA